MDIQKRPNKSPVKKAVVWNTNKSEGWLKHHKDTDKNKVLQKMSVEEIFDPTDYHDRLEKQREKSKYKSFNKVSFKPNKKQTIELNNLMNEKKSIIQAKNNDMPSLDKQLDEIDEKIVTQVKMIQRKEIEKDVKNIEKP